MGLQHPDHQFKSGCRLSGIIERWFLFLCEKPSIYAGFRALGRFWGGEIYLENFIVNFRWKPKNHFWRKNKAPKYDGIFLSTGKRAAMNNTPAFLFQCLYRRECTIQISMHIGVISNLYGRMSKREKFQIPMDRNLVKRFWRNISISRKKKERFPFQRTLKKNWIVGRIFPKK